MEESFPRGKEGHTAVGRLNRGEDLFKSSRPESKKKRKNVLTGEEEELLAGKKKTPKREFLIQHLSYESLCEGLLTLGRVFLVREHEVLVSLPGRTVGSVSIKEVSAPYLRALQHLAASSFPETEVMHSLKGMFRLGDLIVVKVIGVTQSEKGHRVSLSTDPKQIHSHWNTTLLKPGLVLTGAVESKEEHGYIMDIGINGVNAFLPNERSTAFIKNVNNGEPVGIGQLIQVKIVKCEIHRLMATITLSAIPKEVGRVKMDDDMELNYSTLLPGMHVDGIVMDTHKTGMQVHSMGLKALIHQDHLDDAWSLPSKFEISSTLTARILYLEPNGSSPYLSLHPNLWPYGPFRQTKKERQIILGSLAKVRIVRFEKRGLIIRFESGEKGIVAVQRCSDESSWTEDDISKNFPIGTFHDCRVLEFSQMDELYIGSFQRSMIKQDLVKIEQVIPGQKIKCEVILWNDGGAVVTFGHEIKGFIPNLHFSDAFLRNPQEKFPVGKTIKGRVFLVDALKQKVFITAKKSLVRSDGVVLTKYDEAKVGLRGHGVIRKILATGLQVNTIGGLLGFLPASKISKDKMENLKDVFHKGQTIEYKVHEINEDRHQLIFSVYTESLNNGEEEIKTEFEEPVRKKLKLDRCPQVVEGTDGKKKRKRKQKKKNSRNESEEISTNGEMAVTKAKKVSKSTRPKTVEKLEEVVEKKTEKTPVPCKKLLEAIEMHEKRKFEKARKKDEKLKKKEKLEEVVEKTTERTPVPCKKLLEAIEMHEKRKLEKARKKDEKLKKKEKVKKRKKKEEEEEESTGILISTESTSFWDVADVKEDDDVNDDLKEGEPGMTSHTQKVVSINEAMNADEHESKVAKMPNEPSLWIDYMSFVLESGDINKAREIAHRGIQLMGFREESAKLKVWTALLNLECKFGSEESLKKVLEDAERRNDKFSVLKQMALIFDRADKISEAEKTYKRLVSSFRSMSEGWIRFGIFYFHHDKATAARALFERALKALPETEHIPLITKFAGLEIQHGDIMKGRSMLDKTVIAHSKRMDLWLLYANLLIKKTLYEDARSVFNRALEIKLHPKKMKSLLKRFLEFEMEHGTPETLAKFKVKAVDYLDKTELSFPA